MGETRKIEDKADLKSTRDILQKWNEYYVSNDFGIGVQCDKCKKWREVFQYQDKSEVPETWICSMWKIDKRRRGSCRMPSDKTDADFVESLYSPGSLVWAKMIGHPPWPGMIEDCPDSQQYFLPSMDSEHAYHVNFFGSKPLRNWIKESRITDFSTPPPLSPKAKKNKDLQRSIEQANEAVKMTPKDRLKNFSFAVRYKGRWAKIEELDKVFLPPDCSKLKGKEKSTDFKPQVITEEAHEGNEDHHRKSTVRKERNVKSKSEADTKRKSADKKKPQSTVSPKEKTEKNNSYRNQFVDIGKDGTTEKQKSPRKCIKVKGIFKSKKFKDEEVLPVHNDIKISSKDEVRVVDHKEFQPSLSQIEEMKVNNHSKSHFVVLCQDGATEKQELPGKRVQDLNKIKMNGDIRFEDSSMDSDTTIVVDDEDVDNDEIQPTISHKEEIRENNHSRKHLVGLAGAEEIQESNGNCVKLTVKARLLGDYQGEDSPLHNDATISSNNEDMAADNDEFEPSASRKEEMVENNHSRNHSVVLCPAVEKQASSGMCVRELNKPNGDILGEDSPVNNNTTVSLLSEDGEISTDQITYLEHINQVCPSQLNDADTESLSNNDAGNDVSNGNTISDILRERVENFSERGSNTNENNSAEFSQNDRLINHENVPELLENESDVYILDTDPSLLRTPCPSRFTLTNEQISNRCKRFKRNPELADELVNSSNSRYMPYSFHRRRM